MSIAKCESLSISIIRMMNDHISHMDFDAKLDYLNEIADEAERLIQVIWDEEDKNAGNH